MSLIKLKSLNEVQEHYNPKVSQDGNVHETKSNLQERRTSEPCNILASN